MHLLRRQPGWRINCRQDDNHADQFAAFDATLIRAFCHRVAARMLLGGLFAVTILHWRLGYGATRSQGRAYGGKRHRKCNEPSEKEPIHGPCLAASVPARQLTFIVTDECAGRAKLCRSPRALPQALPGLGSASVAARPLKFWAARPPRSPP